jgi:hypothetical protein
MPPCGAGGAVGPQSYAAAGAEFFDGVEEPDGSLEDPPDELPSDELGFALVSPEGLSAGDFSPVGLSPDGLFEDEL